MDCTKKLLRIAVVSAICMMSLFVVASADSGVITGNGVNFRSGPGMDAGIYSVLPRGTVVTTNGASNGWVSVTYNGISGYVSAQYISIRPDTANRSGIAVSRERALSKGQEIVEYAKQFIGTPYVYGGSAPGGFDCSGFTSYVYKQFGYSLNRTAAGQASNGVAVDRANLAPGDLLMFNTGGGGISHVGIYMGNGQMIHAQKPGVALGISDINSQYYATRYICARRILN